MISKGEGEPQRKYPPGTEIETDEHGRRIVHLPQVGRVRLSIGDRNLRGTGLTKGQKYIRKDGHD